MHSMCTVVESRFTLGLNVAENTHFIYIKKKKLQILEWESKFAPGLNAAMQIIKKKKKKRTSNKNCLKFNFQ